VRHTNSTIYYPQGNGQVKSTNKVFGILFTKLVNENQNNWDEHLSTILFSYWISFKVGIVHIPFQLVYGLYPLLHTKYMLPSKPSPIYDPNPMKILTNHLLELEKLHENRLVAQDLIVSNQWNPSLWSQNQYIETKYEFGDYVFWLSRAIKVHTSKFQR
jgi:hypothetical protein